MDNVNSRKVFFFGVENNERNNNNLAYSNFAYSLCYYCLLKKGFDINSFNRMDMLHTNNFKSKLFEIISKYDMFIFLIDELPLEIRDSSNLTKSIPMYNPNVWFELGMAATQINKPIIVIN